MSAAPGSRPLRMVLVPAPGAAGARPWPAVLAAAGASGAEVAVVSAGEARLPAGVLGAIARPAPMPHGDARHPYLPALEDAVRYATAVAEALAALGAAGFVPDVAVADANGGGGLLLAEAVPQVAVIARVAHYDPPPPATRQHAAPIATVLAQRSALVVEELTLAHAHAVVCPSGAVRDALPAPLRPEARVVPDGLEDGWSAEAAGGPGGNGAPGPAQGGAPGGPARPVVTIVGAEEGPGGQVEAARVAVGRLSRAVPFDLVVIDASQPVAARAEAVRSSVACLALGGPEHTVAALAAGGLVVCRHRELIHHGMNGYLADLGHAGHLEAIVGYLVSHAPALGAVRAAARRSAAPWAPDQVGAAYVALAQAAAAGRLAGPRLATSIVRPRQQAERPGAPEPAAGAGPRSLAGTVPEGPTGAE